jgi:dCMP deaminase
MSRLSRDNWALKLAQVTALRSTCNRRQVGCIILNSRGHVLATGYNGVASGLPHCNSTDTHQCPGVGSQSGTNLDGCHAIHAEQNALLQCHDVHEIYAVYTTVSPCITCVKLLMNTSCQKIIFNEDYPHNASRQLWESSSSKRSWIKINRS